MSEIAMRVAAVRPEATSLSDYRRLDRCLTEERWEGEPLEVTLLSSFTTEFLDPFLRVELARSGFRATISRGGFQEFESALLRAEGELADGPSVVLVQMRHEDLDPDSVTRFYATSGTGFWKLTEQILDRVRRCVELVRARQPGAHILVANFAAPAVAPLGVLDASVPESMTHQVALANLELARLARDLPSVFVWDYGGLVAAHGSVHWTDPRMWALAHAVIANDRQPHAASHLARTIRATLRPAAKCLVLDLDHTVWGGTIGDDGVAGIRLGDDHPGNAYKALQRAALGLRDRGVLLAVASKNDDAVARAPFEQHPEMLLRLDDLAAFEAGWGPKSESLSRIAADLGIGLDSLVLFDDNPVEREEVRLNAPAVRVIEVPSDPVLYAGALLASGHFDAATVTDEDLQRPRAYRARAARHSASETATSLDDFLTSLQMTAKVGLLDEGSLARIAQLVAKTNQFNLTTRRRPAAELVALHERSTGVVCWLRLADRFDDLGLIAVGALDVRGDEGVVDLLVMSCRAANRRVEQALVSLLADHARALGARTLVGEYLPTDRNHVVAGLYRDLGFSPRPGAPDGAGASRFELDLRSHDVAWPSCIAGPLPPTGVHGAEVPTPIMREGT